MGDKRTLLAEIASIRTHFVRASYRLSRIERKVGVGSGGVPDPKKRN